MKIFSKTGLCWLLGITLILSHYWLATLRYPYAAGMGTGIHAPSEWASQDKQSLRVSTYNIHRAKGEDDVRDINRTATLLDKDDIAGLQEVLGPGIFSPDQAEQLGKILDTGWLFAPIQTQYYQKYIGNALLSRLPVDDWYRKPLPRSHQLDDEPTSRAYRNLLLAFFQWQGERVAFAVTHLDRGTIRIAQLRYVLQEVEHYDRLILVGDLNTTIASPVVQELIQENNLTDVFAEVRGESDDPARIDYILTRGMQVEDVGEHPVGISDHPYYWAEISLGP